MAEKAVTCRDLISALEEFAVKADHPDLKLWIESVGSHLDGSAVLMKQDCCAEWPVVCGISCPSLGRQTVTLEDFFAKLRDLAVNTKGRQVNEVVEIVLGAFSKLDPKLVLFERVCPEWPSLCGAPCRVGPTAKPQA